MSEQNIDYHKRIEQAIQNVLSKVKKIPLSIQEATNQETAFASQSSSESIAQVGLDTSPDAKSSDNISTHNSHESQEIESLDPGATEQDTSSSPDVYLEADDLYIPIPLEELKTPKSEDVPLIEDNYTPPYNIFEEFVETELNIMLSRYIDLCRCGQCRADIVALALHQLPAYYVTGTRGTLTAKNIIWTKYSQQIIDAVTKAINVVYKRPRSNCKKIKQIIWIKPEIEDISLDKTNNQETNYSGKLFEQVQTEGATELNFSNEVEKIIQMIEQEDNQNKTLLLPLSSPYAHGTNSSDQPPNKQQALPGDEKHITLKKTHQSTSEPELSMKLIEDWD